jgi:hypothetical protein
LLLAVAVVMVVDLTQGQYKDGMVVQVAVQEELVQVVQYAHREP